MNIESQKQLIPRIEFSAEKKLIGITEAMSLANNKTGDLWRKFMPRRNEIFNRQGNDLISMAIYPTEYFTSMNPTTRMQTDFQKWAAAEVLDFNSVPAGMGAYTLEPGLYAVFEYKGLNTDFSIFGYIFGIWLPQSDYFIDDRPHFEILGERYKNNDPESEEEIWIPIKSK